MVDRPTCDRENESSNLGRRIFFSKVNQMLVLTLIRCPFHLVLPQWHVKDPGHSVKSADGKVTPKHAYTLDPMKSEWADYAVQA